MHYSFDRLDVVESTSFYYIEVADSYCLTYRLRTEVDSAECVSPVRGSSISASIVASCACGAVVRCRTVLLSTPIVCVEVSLLLRYCGLG